MGAAFDVLQAVAETGVELDGADRVGLVGVLGAVLAVRPGCMDAADEIDAGVGLGRQFDRLFALADAEALAVHAGPLIGAKSSHSRGGPSRVS